MSYGRITWKDFKDKVREYMPVESDREGVQDYIDRLIRAAYIDLQDKDDDSRYYRIEHETLYTESNTSPDGLTSKFKLPEDSEIRRFVVLQHITDSQMLCIGCNSTCFCGHPCACCGETTEGEVEAKVLRATASQVNWDARHELISKGINGACKPLFAISPSREVGYITPQLVGGERELLVIWDGFKDSFEDEETIRGGEREAEAISYFVLERLQKQIDEVGIADRIKQDWAVARRNLLMRRKEQMESASQSNHEYQYE
jgi:hypothetical protein